MAFTTRPKIVVPVPMGQSVFFDLNPIDTTTILKRPTWVSSTIAVSVNQADDGLTCTFTPTASFSGTADAICDVWLTNGNQERYWWQLNIGGTMNPTVTVIPRV